MRATPLAVPRADLIDEAQVYFQSVTSMYHAGLLAEQAARRATQANSGKGARPMNELKRAVLGGLWAIALALPAAAFTAPAELRVGVISIDPQPIFAEHELHGPMGLFRLANKLHMRTRERTIEAQLLFKTGEVFDPKLLKETERNLRKLKFLREPKVTVVRTHDGVVDIAVVTTDVWTLSPTFSFGRSGGTNRSTIGIEETNFMGLGKQIAVGFQTDPVRDRKFVRYFDPNVGFGRWQMDAEYSQNSDGRLVRFDLERPFFALDTQRAVGLSLLHDDGEYRRDSLGIETDRYGRKQELIDFSYGFSSGLQSDGVVRRLSFGARFERSDFSPLLATVDAPGTLGALPVDRSYVYPYARFEWLTDGFGTERNLRQIGRTEDINFGLTYMLELGIAPRTLSGFDNPSALLAQASVSDAAAWQDGKQLLVWSATFRGRVQDGGIENALLSGKADYFYRWNERSTTLLSASADYGKRLDLDQFLDLGGETGLRAYPNRYQNGTRRALFSAEQRYYSSWQPLHLFHIGAAAFADIGRVSGDYALQEADAGWVREIGIGLRIVNNHTARAPVLHIDLAYPLDRLDGKRGFELIVEVRSSF